MSDQSSNPFAPKGLQQAAAAQDGSRPFAPRAQRTAGDAPAPTEGSPNPFAPKSWYTGANMEGTENGYSTPFFQKFFEQQDKLSKSGKLQDFFDQKDATGIVTWDHGKGADGKTSKFKFGDVYEDGKLVANVYQTYDKATADLLMADLTLDADTKAKAFKAGTPEAIGDEVQSKRKATERETAAFLTQKDFSEKVDKQHAEWDSGKAETTTVAAGTAGGAAVGAGIGSIIPGVGTAIGAGVGAFAGGLGAWLNQDELISQAARAKVTQDMANEQFGKTAGFFTGLQQWGGLGMKVISPASNILHGAYDEATGSVGDRDAGWYRTDAEGQRTRAGWLQAADVGTTLIDAAGQFGSKAGVMLFQGAMGASVAGQVGQLPATGFQTFDDRSGTFDKIYEDQDGNFDLGSLSAGVGSIGIDAIQLGMARGLTQAATSSRAANRAALGEAPAAGSISSQLRAMTGADRVHAGGFSYLLDDAGRAVAGSRRASLSILAPSEAIQGLSASMRARRAAAADGGALTADRFYQAASQMAMGSRTWNAALVNGFGESAEEVTQAILEPLSHNSEIDPEAVWNAALAGFGMGAGMTIGAAGRGVTADQRQYAEAYVVQGALNQTQLTKSEWDAMTPQEKSAATMAPAYVQEMAKEAARKVASDQRASAVANTPALEKYVDAAQRMMEREAGKITSRTDGAFVITQQRDAGMVDADGTPDLGSMPNHAVGSSFTTLRENLARRLDGVQIQLASLPAGDPMLPILEATSTEGVMLHEFLVQGQAQIDGAMQAGALDAVGQVIEQTNDTIRRWFAGDGANELQVAARQRAVSQLFIRDPQDQAGSYQLLMPQASVELTRENANNVLQVSHAILQAIGGDYDGDKIREQAQVILDPAKFENLRTGMNLLGAMGSDGGSVNIMTRPYEEYEITQMSKALAGSGPLKAEAQGVLDRMRASLQTRYAESAIPATDLTRVLDRFVRDIRDNDGKARARLIDSLAGYGAEMTEFARRSLTNEWLWVDQVVQANLQRFQRIAAAHTPAPGEINTTRKPPIAQTSQFRAVAADAAATDAMTMSLRTAGHSLFRMFQALHYSSWNAPVEGTQKGNDEAIVGLTALYEELSQGMTRTVLDALDASDEVMARVQHQLRALAADARKMAEETGAQLDGASALAIVANLSMPWVDNAGTLHTGTTAAQALLARETIRARAEHAASMTPELASKYARYDRMARPGQAENAFVEVMGSVQLYELLGPAAQALGSNLTVEQYVRQYVNQSEAAKQDTARLLKTEPEYLGRESKQNIPYSLEEIDAKQISGYTSVIDSIVAAGNERVTITTKGRKSDGLGKGRAGGELGQRNDTYHETLVNGFRQVQLAIRDLEKMRRGLNRKKPDEARAWLAATMDANPEWARSVMALIPDAATNAVMQTVTMGGRPVLKISPWVYDMLLMTDPQEAAMHYWRSVTIAQWNVLGGGSANGADADKARTFASLDSRFQQLLYRTAAAEDRGISMAKLMVRMQESKDLDEFFAYVNKEHRQSEAPYMPWIDDVSELSTDKASAGLSAAMPGALQREAISEFSTRSMRLAKAINAQVLVQKADDVTMTTLSRALAEGDKASEADRILLQRAQEVLDFAKEQRTTLGPGAMRAMTMGSLLHFFGQAHTKGISPWPYVPIGAFEALGDSLGFKTPFGQHESAVVGTQDAEDIGGNMPMGARDALESMTADGTPIFWDQLTLEKLVEVYRDRPDAGPAIRAMLFPSVRERTETGQISQQFLTGQSITELLEKRTYEDLLAPTHKGRALYLSMIEARSKNFGGNYPVMRLANELVIARSSSLRQGLTPVVAETMVEKAYEEIAEVLQIVGEIAAMDPTVKNQALGELKAQLRSRIRTRQAGAMLGLEGKDADSYTAAAFDGLIQAKRAETIEMAAAAPDPETAAGIKADFESLVRKVELIMSDTPFERVAEAYRIPWNDSKAAAQKQQEIIEYVRTHPYLVTKASWAKTELRELTSWLIAPNPLTAAPELDRKTWDTISRAIVGTYLDEMSTDTADGVSVPVYPDSKKEAQLRYWDPTYSYLFDDLLDPDGAMVKAAAELHLASGRRGVRNATGSLVNALLEKIYRPGSLGPWTSDIPRLSIEAGSRLDASAAADAVAMAGLSPRNEASESAATRRTFALPPEEAFSVASIDMVTLTGNQSVGMVETTLAGVPSSMPLMRMNGRFARGATLEYVDADGATQQVDLWAARPVLGRTHVQDPAAAESGLRSLTVNQLRAAVGRHLPDGVTNARVMVDFVHPDAQPAQGYAHNLFFEGTSFELDADSQDSLNATLWFAPGSVSPNEQAKALQANKSGKPALEVTDTVLSQQREELEGDWVTDFAGMLTRKTMHLMTNDLGSGRFQPAFFNAVFKRQKMRHFVRGFSIAEDGSGTGAPELWTAEMVIEFQRANPGVGLPLAGAQLWKPSSKVLRSMLGEGDAEGALVVLDGQPELDVSKIPVWTGDPTAITARMPGVLATSTDGEFATADLLDTPAAQRTFQSQLAITPPLSDERRTAYAAALSTADARRTAIHVARQAMPGVASQLRDWTTAAANKAGGALNATSSGLDGRSVGLPFIGPRNIADVKISEALFVEMHQVLDASGLRAAWIFQAGPSDKRGPIAGIFNEVSLGDAAADKGPRHLQLAPDDIVVVDLDSFEATYTSSTSKALAAGEKALEHMMRARATIALPDGTTGGDLRHNLGQYLREHNYRAVPGSKHLFQPQPASEVYATPQARMTTLTETHAISAQSTVTVFHSQDFPIAENAAQILNPGQRHPVAVAMDLVPVNLFDRFNVPVESAQVAAVQQTILAMDDATRAMLYEAMGTTAGTAEAADFDAAVQRLVDTWDADPTNPRVTPRRGADFGTGDIIPLLDAKTGDILLLRHGHELPDATTLREQLTTAVHPGERARGLAVSSTKINAGHTTRRGQVIEFQPRSQYGLTAMIRVPLQEYGDKLQLEGNGMKLVLTEAARGIEMPEHGLFEDWPIDLATNWADSTSKESFLGLVDNFRNAIAFFGVDFRGELVEALFGQDLAALSPAQRVDTLGALNDLLLAVQNGRMVDVAVAHDLMRASAPGAMLTELFGDLGGMGGTTADWVSAVSTPTATPAQQITRGILLYLATPQGKVEHVLESGGFNAPGARTGNGKSIMMPQLFTNMLDRAPFGSALRKHMIGKINDQVFNPTAEQGYHLAEDFSFHATSRTGTYSGWLQFSEAHSSGDNPVTNDMAFTRSTDQKVSAHSLDIAFQAIGGRTAIPRDLAKTAAWHSREGIETFEKEGALWNLMRSIPKADTTYLPWRELTPAESEYKSLARDAVSAFRKPLSQESWTVEEVAAFEAMRIKVALAYGLKESQAGIVDFWVRQMLGQPLGEGDAGRVTHRNAMETMELEILWNANNGYLPVHGAEVPQLHFNDLSVLHRAAEARGATGFQLKETLGEDARVTSWDDWTHVAIAIGETEQQTFDPMFRLATDGMLHTYVDAADALVGLPVTRNRLLLEKLIDPDTSRMVLSIDPNQNTILAEAPLMDPTRATLDAIMGGQRMAGGRVSMKDVPASVRSRRDAARRKWRKENHVPQPMPMSLRNFRETGAQFVDESTTSSSILRILINLRVGNALFNPFLWVSAIAETVVRGGLEDVTNLLMGDSTTLAGRVTSRYSSEQLKQFRQRTQVLGQRTEFKGMIYRDLHFQLDRLSNAGRIERWTHNFARFGSSIQDPTYGMRGDVLARHYLEAVLAYVASTPMDTAMSPEYIVAKLESPTWVMDHLPEAHKAALATLANIRSLKPTPLSLALRGVYEPLSQNPNLLVALPSTLFLKLPLMFSGYAMNVATNILGLQGAAAFTAMFAEGRSKGFIGRIQAAMAGREYDEDRDGTYDMSEVLEGVDLSKAFIQGGVTHTSLFALGMLSGGLNLSGESEEDKRRRRMASVQGAGYVYDPRKIENDFRNADAMFVDWLPFGLDSMFRVTDEDSPSGQKSMVNLHWTLKQFISPLIGMEKFFNTGDPRQIVWGFQEAINSFPLINSAGWADATATFAELSSQAAEHEALGTPDDLNTAFDFMMKGVWTMERMLFENAFVNMLYVGADKYDRDQYKIPMVDSAGNIQVFGPDGTPRPTEMMSDYVDPETGEVKSGYVTRDYWDAQVHGFSENRATLAVLGSLFTGFGDSTMLRTNMVAKTRTIEKPALTPEQAMGLVLSEFDNRNVVIKTTVDGVTYAENGSEVLTEAGARAVFHGVWKKSVAFGDPALEGVFIPYEMRKNLQAKMMADLTQEGIDMGLTEAKAKSRMFNIWNGPSTDPNVPGLAEILWSDQISYAKDLRYNQLNTTYVMGPDGMPWATGVTRDSMHNAFGLLPVNRYYAGDVGNLGVDSRLNSVDGAAGLNTGLRGLERIDETWYVPTAEEIAEELEKGITKALQDSFSSQGTGSGWQDYGDGSGWRNFGRRGGYRRGGGGGGYSSGGTFTKLNAPQDSNVPYDNSIPFINTSTPIIRRATIRRERFDSDRGRLNQWQ